MLVQGELESPDKLMIGQKIRLRVSVMVKVPVKVKAKVIKTGNHFADLVLILVLIWC